MRNTLDELLKIRSLDVYNYYIAGLYPGNRVVPKKNITNPFLLPHKQDTPSFNVFKANDGKYIFNDFATGDKGDCITFVQRMANVPRSEARMIINHRILVPQPRKYQQEY